MYKAPPSPLDVLPVNTQFANKPDVYSMDKPPAVTARFPTKIQSLRVRVLYVAIKPPLVAKDRLLANIHRDNVIKPALQESPPPSPLGLVVAMPAEFPMMSQSVRLASEWSM